MTEDIRALDAFGGIARLFPLPNLVLFPGAVQQLHIFEPRYRQLMADTLNDDKLFALILLKPGWDEHYDGKKPKIEQVACLGRVTDHQKLPDGRYNLQLKGLARVQLQEELYVDTLYRQARVEVLLDQSPTDLETLKEQRKRLAEVVLARFEAGSPANNHLTELFSSELPLGPVCDLLAYALPLSLEMKQCLLVEQRVLERVEILFHAMQIKSPGVKRGFPPKFSSN